jgi:hypothetical protein
MRPMKHPSLPALWSRGPALATKAAAEAEEENFPAACGRGAQHAGHDGNYALERVAESAIRITSTTPLTSAHAAAAYPPPDPRPLIESNEGTADLHGTVKATRAPNPGAACTRHRQYRCYPPTFTCQQVDRPRCAIVNNREVPQAERLTPTRDAFD